MALDLSKGYLVPDAPVTISYKSKTAPGTFSTYSVAYVHRRMTMKSQVDAAAGLQTREAYFHVWRAPLTAAGMSAVPKRDDLIDSPAGVEWLVREVEECDLDSSGLAQRFRCRCVTPD